MENKVINDVRNILNASDVKIIERLLGGMSNYTYVVSADDILYTFREPGPYSEFFVDRNIEKENIKLFEELNITNETIYFNTIDGKKIAKYIPGNPLNTVKPEEYPLDKVADILKIIHNSNKLAKNDYNPFGRLEYYERIVKGLGYEHSEEYLKTKQEFYTYKEYLDSQEKVLCHGDSQPSNFVKTKDRVFVVDFEYCGNIDPIYDIACFSNMRYEDGYKLLHEYYQEPNKDQRNRFHLWRAFQAFQWHNVAVFKELKGMSEQLHIDFKKVAQNYLDLTKFLLSKIEK